MASLEEFTPYTSYRLHWYPYELARCVSLRRSTVSTRALYGNYKNRPPFPLLGPYPAAVPVVERSCSVCGAAYPDRGEHRVWVSLRVATDVLPLLVNACSVACVGNLPAGAANHVEGPHRGGPGVARPARGW